jgi:preprotein translocase subunit SecG
MYQALTIVHVLIALSIIGLVLLQQGRGAGAGAGFGGGSSGSLFGARGAASFLSRTTAILATLFFASSLLLAYLAGKIDNKHIDVMDAPVSTQAQPDLPPVSSESTPRQSDLPQEAPEAEPDRSQ